MGNLFANNMPQKSMNVLNVDVLVAPYIAYFSQYLVFLNEKKVFNLSNDLYL